MDFLVFFERMIRIATKYSGFFGRGVVNTLIIAFFAVLLGTLLGTLLAVLKMGKFAPTRWLATAYVEFVRGTPLMIQLMFIFYGLPMLNITFPQIPFIPNSDRFAAAIFAMSLNSAAYVAEIIRSGIQAVDKGQFEAARSLGFKESQALRMVVLPQAIKNILPALGNEFVTVIKESSIVSVIGIADLMYQANGVIANTFITLETLAVAAIIYFIMTFVTSRLIAFAERKMANGTR